MSQATRNQNTELLGNAPARGLRIIVADDDARMREFYEAVLTQIGHQVVGSAANGKQLAQLCFDTQADLVVTDIRMPEMDGLSAARIVSACLQLPFLFVSAYHDAGLIFEASSRSLGYGYLVKPVRQEDLAAAIPIAVRRFRER